MRDKIKKHLISFVVTFLAMICLFIAPIFYQGGEITVAVVLAAIIAAARSAFKIAWELFLVPLLNMLIEWAKRYVNSN